MVNSGPERDSNRRQRGQRHHLAVRVADVELADVLGSVAIVAFGLDVDLPLAAEAVEVVDERPAHERLDGPVDIVDGDALLEHLVAIHVDELLRHAGQEGRAHAARSPDACARPP